MFGKMILPMFGGSPSVWLTALVFFQLMLLVGYLYVYATTSWLGIRKQAALHLLILVLPLVVLPVRVLTGRIAISPMRPLASVSWTLVFSIGLPFFALSARAPLLQRWFATTSDPAAHDPYFLYAASFRLRARLRRDKTAWQAPAPQCITGRVAASEETARNAAYRQRDATEL